MARPAAALPAARLHGFRRLFPAPHRRADRAALGNHPSVCRSGAEGKPRGHGRWHRDVPARPLQKGAARRSGVALCRHCIRRAGSGNDDHVVRRLARHHRLRGADLLRLLGLLRHGHRARADVRDEVPVQLRLALQGGQHHRILEALAHHAPAIPARVPLLSARRKPLLKSAPRAQHPDHDGRERPVARRGMDVSRVGRAARRVSRGRAPVAEIPRGARLAAHSLELPRRVRGADVHRGAVRVGVLPRKDPATSVPSGSNHGGRTWIHDSRRRE